MSIEELSPEELAKVFFHYHEMLAPDFGCSTGSQAHTWNEISHRERSHMVTAARLALLEIGMAKRAEDPDRNRYFVKPGNAEWGC
jgi:hypothetical protein